jgi:Kef-type K+ transport system membrane component KefB
MSNFELSIVFFLELAVIVLACRLVGLAVRGLGQPQVVGEMITGVLLGPSLLGWALPDLHAALFPKPALTIIYCCAQLGLVLYMFLVGLEFDVKLIRQRVRSAVAVSWAGILAPFSLGALIAWIWHDDHGLFTAGVRTWEGMLFMGAAMSITAFPMLARIIHERGLAGTSLGTLALAAGSADDAAAWCILAIVLASFGAQPSIALLAIGGGLLFALIVLGLLSAPLARLWAWLLRTGRFEDWGLPGTLLLLFLAAYATDRVGIYAVFGAFVLGIAMPRGEYVQRIQPQIEPLTRNLLLPLFFVYSGLNTHLGLVGAAGLWGVALLVLLAACLGKGGACYLAARLSGEPRREAVAIGALMNARGLMELIILNIGLERGLVTPVLFSVMVLMAVVTTLMATPLFNLVYSEQDTAAARAAGVRARAVGSTA